MYIYYILIWGRSSPVWCWTDSKCWLNMSIQRRSAASDSRDQRLTWSFHWDSCRRSAGSKDSHSTSPSSTWPRPSTWSAGKASSHYCTGSDVPTSFWRWSRPSMMNERYRPVWWLIFRTFPDPKRREARLCSHPDTLRHLFLPAAAPRHAFSQSEYGVFIRTRSDGNLFNLARLRAKTKVRRVLIREMLFADDAALTAHTEEALQRLISSFARASDEFGLTISLKKTNVMGQDVSSTPCISIGDHTLEVVEDFTYLGSTISSNLSLDNELNTRIGKASIAMARLTKRVWNNSMLTTNTKMKVYQASVLSTLLYGSETWTMYTWQERRLNSFHLRCLRRILGITWQGRVPNTEVLAQAKKFSMHALLSQRRLRWLGHVCRMQDGRIPKDIMYGELASGTRPTGRPALRYKDVCKRDLKARSLNPSDLEAATADRVSWWLAIRTSIKLSEGKREDQWEEKRQRRRQGAESVPTEAVTGFTCSNCNRLCRSRIGLFSHSSHCNSTTDWLGRRYSIISRDRRMPYI